MSAMTPQINGSGGTFNGKHTPEYVCWINMIRRCYEESSDLFRRYKARGITVCDRWFVYTNFLADMGHKPGADFELDREDTCGNYEKSNCKWVTRSINARNKIKSKGIPFNGISLHKVGALLIARVSFDDNTSKRTNHSTIIEALNSRNSMCKSFNLPEMSRYDADLTDTLIEIIDFEIIQRLKKISQPERKALNIDEIYKPLISYHKHRQDIFTSTNS